MRLVAIFLILASTSAARADCREPADSSAARALSDVPYAPDQAAPCRAQSSEPREGWARPRDERRASVMRAGTIGVTLGAGLLLLGANFAVCAHHAPEGTATACRDAAAPLLISGAASAALGLGAIGFATWFLPDEQPQRRTGLSAGLALRLAWN